MQKTLFVLIFICSSIQLIMAQEETKVTDIELTGNTTIITGHLEDGAPMPLRWAENSQVACFPGTRFIEFQGNHVLYRMVMPPYSELKVTVTPKDRKNRTNVYALRLGANNYDLPPDIVRAISCEASYPLYAGNPNLKAPAKPQSIEYISVNKPYNIVIGVAGAKEVLSGEYELKIELKSR